MKNTKNGMIYNTLLISILRKRHDKWHKTAMRKAPFARRKDSFQSVKECLLQRKSMPFRLKNKAKINEGMMNLGNF